MVSAYVACPDITLTVTPDLKLPGAGRLVHVDLTGGRRRLGGSALAHAYGQARGPLRQLRLHLARPGGALRCSLRALLIVARKVDVPILHRRV